jgi:RIP metalloprotease RseP
MSLLQTILATLVTLGLLVTIHEWGHFWVARRCGVKVLRFSVGFGKPLWMRVGRDGTEYTIAAIPLGGYVRMLDEREGDVPESLRAQAFNNKPVLQRIAIVAAGPLVNLLFAVLAYWFLFIYGVSSVVPW